MKDIVVAAAGGFDDLKYNKVATDEHSRTGTDGVATEQIDTATYIFGVAAEKIDTDTYDKGLFLSELLLYSQLLKTSIKLLRN